MREIIKVKIRRFIARYLSSIVFCVYYFKFKVLDFNNKTPIIILTPGKTGSSSVYFTLKKVFKMYNVFHIHYLSLNSIDNAKQNHLVSDRKSLPLHLIVSELLLNKIKNYKGTLKIITILREPVSRSISSFFQNIDFHKNSLEELNLIINESRALKIIERQISSSVDDVNNWINLEIKENFNIDIYENKFPNKKYIIFKNQNVELLLLKVEDLDSVFENATKEFFNLRKGLSLINYNIGSEKYYSNQYETIKNKIKLSDENIEKIFSSDYILHFYKNDVKKLTDKYKNN
jgi:hypothetical protein